MRGGDRARWLILLAGLAGLALFTGADAARALLGLGDGAPTEGAAGGASDTRSPLEDLGGGVRLEGLPEVHLRRGGHGRVVGAVRLHQDGADRPLPGVRVHLVTEPAAGPGAPAPAPREASSDAEGAFAFEQVPAQAGAVLLVEHPPWRRVVLKGVLVQAQRTTDLGVVLLGAPTLLAGEVVDARGRPLGGAVVQVLRDESQAERFDLRRGLFELQDGRLALATAKAESDGRFLVRDLPPGRYLLRVHAPGHATAFKAGVWVSVDERSSAVRVVLDPGAGLSGQVLDEAGGPLGAARVIAVAIPGAKVARLDRMEARTGSDGRYRLDTLVPGVRYFVEAWAEGHAPVGHWIQTGEGVEARDFTLPRSGAVEGEVRDADDGTPVAGAQVTLVAGPSFTRLAPVATVTDDHGRFALRHVLPGPVLLLSLQAPGYVPEDGIDTKGLAGLVVRPDETLWIERTLRRGGVLAGRVVDERGRPVPYATVALADPRRRLEGEQVALGDAQGQYRIEGVRAATYEVHASAPGYAPLLDPAAATFVMPESLGEHQRDLVLAAGATVRGVIRDPEGAPVRGARVWLEAQGGREVRDRVRGLGAVTGATGGYALAGAPPGVDLVLRAEHDAWVPAASAALRLRPGEDRTLDLGLKAGARLVGRVLDERGAGLADARVRWGGAEGLADRDVEDAFRADAFLGARVLRTDVAGRFEVVGLAPGRLLLKVEREGYADWYRSDLRVPPEGDPAPVEATLVGALEIRGAVRSASGAGPLAGAFVYARERSAGADAEPDPGRVQAVVSCETDAAGRYRLTGLPPGLSEVVVWFAPGHVGAAQDWRNERVRRRDVPAGASGVDFELDPFGSAGPEAGR